MIMRSPTRSFQLVLLAFLALSQFTDIRVDATTARDRSARRHSPLGRRSLAANQTTTNVTIYDFGLGVWPENLYVRPNGQILTTIINRPQVWQINPFLQQDGVVVHTWEGKSSTLGIVETFPDIFHLLVGNFTTSPKFNGVTGTYGVWELDFTAQDVTNGSLAKVSHIVEIPEAEILDGMEVLNHELGLVAVADCKAGVLYTVNVKNKTADAIVTNQLFNSTSELYIGIDGIKLRTNGTSSYLYFTNAAKGFLGRIQMDITTGLAIGSVEQLPVKLDTRSSGEIVLDDFIFDEAGNAYLTNAGVDQGIYRVPAPANEATNATFITPITGPTACRFGRTEIDPNALYITSTGGDFNYPNMSFTVTSKLARIFVSSDNGD